MASHRPASTRRRALPTLALAATLALAPTAAGAHGAEGELTILTAEQADTDTVRIEVGILYANDGDLAEEAQASATLTDGEGGSVGPVDLPRIRDARYGAEVDVPAPGAWEVVVTSTGPDAEATGTVEVEAATTTTTTTTTTTSTSIAASTDDTSAAAASTDDDDGGVAATVLALGAAAVVVVAAGGVVAARRAGRRGEA